MTEKTLSSFYAVGSISTTSNEVNLWCGWTRSRRLWHIQTNCNNRKEQSSPNFYSTTQKPSAACRGHQPIHEHCFTLSFSLHLARTLIQEDLSQATWRVSASYCKLEIYKHSFKAKCIVPIS